MTWHMDGGRGQKIVNFCGRPTCIPPQEGVCNATVLDSLASLNESWGNGEDFQSALQIATMASEDEQGRSATYSATYSFTVNVNEDNYCQYPTSRHILRALNCPPGECGRAEHGAALGHPHVRHLLHRLLPAHLPQRPGTQINKLFGPPILDE